MPRARSGFRNRAEALAVRALRGAFARVPPERAEAIGRQLGLAYRRLDRRRRELARVNIASAFPGKSEEDVDALARGVFAHFGGLAAELLHASARPVAETIARVEFPRAGDALEALRSGRGILFLTAHLGNWEYSAIGMAANGIPASVVARALDNPLLDAWLTAFRTSNGNEIIDKHDAARGMLRTLRSGRVLGVLADQHVGPPDGIPVPFFGRPASTTSALARIVDRTEALVMPAAAIRIAPSRYRLIVEQVLDVRSLPPEKRGVAELTARFNAILEDMIRRHPEQWLWLHNRWRSLPEPAP